MNDGANKVLKLLDIHDKLTFHGYMHLLLSIIILKDVELRSRTFLKVIWIWIVFISTNAANIQYISILMLFHFTKIEMRNTLFVGCEFVTRIFTFASVHVKDFTFFLVLVRTVSKEIIIFHFRLECNHISKRTKKYIKFSNNKKPNIDWVKL